MVEIWMPIRGYEGIYEISNTGRIKSLARTYINRWGSLNQLPEKILSNVYDAKGYLVVRLCNADGAYKGVNFKVHRLVAEAFIPNPGNKPEVNHINGRKDDNNVGNLEWATGSENKKHAQQTGLLKDRKAKSVKVYMRGQLVDIVMGTTKASKKYKIGKTTLLEIIRGERKGVNDISFSF
jgi:hypothetical protein